MNGSKDMQHILENGGIIRVLGTEIIFTAPDTKASEAITASPARILKKLLDTPNSLVSYAQLYCAYQEVSKPSDGFVRSVQLIISTLPSALRKNLRNHSRQGYVLLVSNSIPIPENATQEDTTETLPPELRYFPGAYYALYPSKDGSQILGAYIHIQKAEDRPAVYAVLDIQHSEDLETIHEEFADCCDAFPRIDPDKYKMIDGRNFFKGALETRANHVIAITLDNRHDCDHWQLVLNIKDFMSHPRSYEKDENLYRCGLGLKLGGWSSDISACRIAIIRKSLFIKKYMGINSEYIRNYLTASSCVGITERLDHDFYQWVISKHSLIDK